MARRFGLVTGFNEKKVKPLKGMTPTVKLKKLGELQKIEKEFSARRDVEMKRFESQDKLLNKARKLRGQLGI